ncbi:MAG: C45 family autoproteolytic acyltransferase/hydrolase [Acidimicrobiia bacterium]
MGSRVSIVEDRIGPLPWIKLSGEREAVSFALGERSADELRSVISASPELPALQEMIREPGFSEISEDTRGAFPDLAQEVDSLAAGAGVDPTDLWLLNLRGDLGVWGEGCSDVAVWNGVSQLMAHNEDGHESYYGKCAVLTLDIPGDPAVFTFWYPGLLPGISFWLNSSGLAGGVNHIPSRPVGAGVGRHFLARHLSRATSKATAMFAAEATSLAGCYAFTLGTGGDGISLLEVSPVGTYTRDVSGSSCHTNHFVGLAPDMPPDPESLDRLARLQPVVPNLASADDLLDVMSRPGLWRNGEGAGQVTLCTFVVDFVTSRVHIRPRGAANGRTMSFDELCSVT